VDFKGTPSQEEHKTIFSGLGKTDWLWLVKLIPRAFLSLRKMTYWNLIDYRYDNPSSLLNHKMALHTPV
jgi:hypothetical protein